MPLSAMSFPGDSDSKESACNTGRSGFDPQVWNILEKEMPTHFSIFAWRIHEQRSLAGYGPQGRQELEVNEPLALSHFSHSANAYPFKTIITLLKLLEMNDLFAIYTSRMSSHVYT